MAIVPILNILFKIDSKSYEYIPVDIHNLNKDVLVNNAYYFVSNFVATNGAFYTLALMGGVLIFMTMLKTAGYFASSAVMVPLRTGIVRDIRIQVYNKVLSLPLSFFSEERKGDIHRSCLSNEKLKSLFGWKPSYNLNDGLKDTLSFFTQREKNTK